VSRKLARDFDYQTLVDPSAPASRGRFHPEYAFGGDGEARTLFEMTPAHLRDDYLSSCLRGRMSPGLSTRITVEPIRSERPFVWTRLELFDDHGPILESKLDGRPRLEWRHPLYSSWLNDAREALGGRTDHAEPVEAALGYCCGGFEAASMFTWPVTLDASRAAFAGSTGPDIAYDERRRADTLGEFTLCDLALASYANAEIARSVVERIGLDDAIILVMELDESPTSLRTKWVDSSRERLGIELFDLLDRAVNDVDYDARDLYARWSWPRRRRRLRLWTPWRPWRRMRRATRCRATRSSNSSCSSACTRRSPYVRRLSSWIALMTSVRAALATSRLEAGRARQA